MLSLQPERRKVNGREMLTTAFSAAQTAVQRQMSARLNQLMAQNVAHLLGRATYVRRAAVSADWEQAGCCCNCQSHHCDHFSRNGYRSRILSCLDYQLHLQLPRVVCQYGGSMRLDFTGLLRPYQRLSDEGDAQIQRWGQMGHSLREMQAELQHCQLGPLGLRTLCERLHQLQDLTPGADELVTPPVVQVDAIWLSQLRPTGQLRRNAKGRLRAVKGVKRCLLIATRLA